MLKKIFDSCLFGDKLVITDVLEADLDGNLPTHEVTNKNLESADGENEDEKLQKTSLLLYLSDRPKLVSLSRRVSAESIRYSIGHQNP